MAAVDPTLLPWPLPRSTELRDRLFDAYGAPGRGYHDQRHLAEVIGRLLELRGVGEGFDFGTVVLAAWFHDAVYEGGTDDEERSAQWAETALTETGLAAAEVAEVARLVRMTAEHRPAEGDANGAALSDADLAILAADEERYGEYLAGVRTEFWQVPDEVFRAGRAAVLADLAAKPHLFHTRHARENWEAPARANLTRELAELG